MLLPYSMSCTTIRHVCGCEVLLLLELQNFLWTYLTLSLMTLCNGGPHLIGYILNDNLLSTKLQVNQGPQGVALHVRQLQVYILRVHNSTVLVHDVHCWADFHSHSTFHPQSLLQLPCLHPALG